MVETDGVSMAKGSIKMRQAHVAWPSDKVVNIPQATHKDSSFVTPWHLLTRQTSSKDMLLPLPH